MDWMDIALSGTLNALFATTAPSPNDVEEPMDFVVEEVLEEGDVIIHLPYFSNFLASSDKYLPQKMFSYFFSFLL